MRQKLWKNSARRLHRLRGDRSAADRVVVCLVSDISGIALHMLIQGDSWILLQEIIP